MSLVKLVYEFSLEEFEKFSESTNGIELITDDLLNKFAYFEFDSKIGRVLYKNTFTNYNDKDILTKEIESIKDYFSLGSILYSEALFAQKHRSVLLKVERQWYSLMFSRLAYLTKIELDKELNYGQINKLYFEYKEIVELENGTHRYNELVVLNREENYFIFNRIYDDKVKFSISLDSLNIIIEVLDNFSSINLFSNIKKEEVDDFLKTYKFIIEYENGKTIEYDSTFNKENLPSDYKYFAQAINYLIENANYNEMLNFNNYSYQIPRKDLYMFCYVTFNNSNKQYCYICYDTQVKVGNSVIVPVGKDNKYSFAYVNKILFKDELHAPFPISKIKRILVNYNKDYNDFLNDLKNGKIDKLVNDANSKLNNSAN